MPNPNSNPILDALMNAVQAATQANIPHPLAPLINAATQANNLRNNVDLGKIVVNPNQQPQQAPPPAPPMPPPQAVAPSMPQNTQPQGSSPVMEFLRQMGIPIASTVAGVANPNWLPGAAGMSTGFNTGMKESKDRNLEYTKLGVEQLDKKQKLEKEKWDDSYRTAIELSKTGALGGIETMTPIQLDSLAGEVYKVRYGSNTKDIAKKVEDKYIGSNKNEKYSQEDLDFTAKKYGITVDEVKTRLGVK